MAVKRDVLFVETRSKEEIDDLVIRRQLGYELPCNAEPRFDGFNYRSPNYSPTSDHCADECSINAKDGTTTSGVFDEALHNAVRAFQRRYFSGGSAANKGNQFSLGRIDFETAFAIQSVQQDSGP